MRLKLAACLLLTASALLPQYPTPGPGSGGLFKPRTFCMPFGTDNGAALADADLGPQGGQFRFDSAATVLEVSVKANAGQPSLLPRKEHGLTLTSLLSGALQTAASGAVACANAGGTLSLDGVTTCTNTLTTTTVAAGDWLGTAAGGVAGGVAVRASVCVTVSN